MNSTTDAVLVLGVELGDFEGVESLGLDDISLGGGINNVSDGESLDSFVLGDLPGTVGTGNSFDTASVGFSSTGVSSLSSHSVCGNKLIIIIRIYGNIINN